MLWGLKVTLVESFITPFRTAVTVITLSMHHLDPMIKPPSPRWTSASIAVPATSNTSNICSRHCRKHSRDDGNCSSMMRAPLRVHILGARAVSAFGFGGTNFHAAVEEYTHGFLSDRSEAGIE